MSRKRKRIERVATDVEGEIPSEKWQNTEILTGFMLFKVTLNRYRRLFGIGKYIQLKINVFIHFPPDGSTYYPYAGAS